MGKILPISVICCILLILAGINRGFDFSDEGLYVLLADPMQSNVSGIFNYDLFFKFIHRFSGYTFSLVELRFFRLLTYLAGAWALTGFWKNISGEQKWSSKAFWISCLGIFAGYGFLPPTLSYNSLVVVLACYWLKLVSEQKPVWSNRIYLGCILALFAYIKISLVLIFIPMTLWVMLIWKKDHLSRAAFLFLPFLFLEFLFYSVIGESAFTRLLDGIPMNSQRPTYQFKLIIRSVLVGGLWMVLSSGLFFSLGHFWPKKNPIRFVFLAVGACGFFIITYQTHITDEWNHLLLLGSAAVLGFYIGHRGIGIIYENPWAVFLIFLPLILHFGSNVYWLRIGIHYWVFWILAFCLLSQSNQSYLPYSISPLVFILVFNGIWWHPFEQEKPLWAEKTAWISQSNKVLYLDPEQVKVIEEIKKWGEERGSEELLAAYRIPGMVWLAGFRLPFSPGYWEKAQLDAFFETKPKEMIYCNLENLPENWTFEHSTDLGQFQGNSLFLLWD